MPNAPTLDHPTFQAVKARFAGKTFQATEFRGQATLIVGAADLHEVMAFLKSDPASDYNFLSDVIRPRSSEMRGRRTPCRKSAIIRC